MKKIYLLASVVYLFSAYGAAKKEVHVENYHGVLIDDPYRYFEDREDEETKRWASEQSKASRSFLDGLPQREAIRKQIEKFWNFKRVRSCFRAGDYYYFLENSGLQNQYVVYRTHVVSKEREVLVDPNLISSEGDVSLECFAVSPDGKFFAYALSENDSDWLTGKILNLETGKALEEDLIDLKFTNLTWDKESLGFYYTKYERGDKFESRSSDAKIYYHKVGTNQEDDLLIFDGPNSHITVKLSDEKDFLILSIYEGTYTNSSIVYKKVGDKDPFKRLLTEYDATFDFVGNRGSWFGFWTNLNAPNGRLIAVNIETDLLLEVLPEKELPLIEVYNFEDDLVAHYLKDASSHLELYQIDGLFKKVIPVPPFGTVLKIGKGRAPAGEIFYFFTSFSQPLTRYSYNTLTDETKVIIKPEPPFSSDDYETKQVFYKSKDGTEIPLFLFYKKGTVFNGNSPVYLTAYGGFSHTNTPSCSPNILAWVELGGIYAVANVRGGGEYGEKWHQSGSLLNKQNTFDDFICAAEYLIDQNITTQKRLAIGGRSNGGLLIGAVLTQRPDLFGMAALGVGVLDMLRFDKFTVGSFWRFEYGSPENAKQFSYLLDYSPVHNIHKHSIYPPTLILAADLDNRVVPMHSYKFGAMLQETQKGDGSILIRIEPKGGHGLRMPLSKLIDEYADLWAFFLSN